MSVHKGCKKSTVGLKHVSAEILDPAPQRVVSIPLDTLMSLTQLASEIEGRL